MTTTTKAATDNTLKTIGFHFQYLIALECCLNSKRGEFIHIEQYGDVSDSDSILEVKHHIDEKDKLSDRHTDFWKTLKNWVESYKIVEDYSKIVLLTTSVVNDESAFYNWNNLPKEEKYTIIQKIKNEKTTETMKPFVSKIFDFSSDFKKHHLLEILDKFQIKHSHLGIQQKIKSLSLHDKLALIPEKNKISFLHALLGKVALWGIGKKNFQWEISMNEFMNYLETEGRHYMGKAIPLPRLPKAQINYASYADSNFIKEINKIGLDKRFIDKAIDDFHQAGRIQVFLIDQDIEYSYIIQEYEDEIENDIWYEKASFTNRLNNTIDLRSQSEAFYIECMKLLPKEIKNIERNTPEFQRGTIHRVVDNEKICWLIEQPQPVFL